VFLLPTIIEFIGCGCQFKLHSNPLGHDYETRPLTIKKKKLR